MNRPHVCDVKQTTGLLKLPPNASKIRRYWRSAEKILTLEPYFVRSRRFFRNKSSVINEQKRHIKSGYSYVIHPLSRFGRYRQVAFAILWGLLIFITPLRACFGFTYEYLFTRTDLILFKESRVEDFIGAPMQTILIVAEFFSGYIDTHTKEIVIDPKRIARRYLRTYFIFDVMSLLPTTSLLLSEKYIRFLNLLGCTVRVFTVVTYIKECFLDCNVRSEIYSCVEIALTTMYMLNLFTGFFVLLPGIMYYGMVNWPKECWMVRAAIDPKWQVHPVVAFSECLTCIIFHFFGAGYGFYLIEDVPHEHALLTLVMIVGRIWTLYMIAHLLRTFSVVTISETKYEEYLLQLQVYMREKKLPKQLRAKLLKYYRYKYQNHFFNETAIFSTLSATLKQELTLYGARHLVAKVDVFKILPKAVVSSIIDSAKVDVYLPQDVIAKRGDIIENVNFISSGTVCVLYDNLELAHLEDGDDIGLNGVVNHKRYKFTYIAIETTEVYVVNVEEMKRLIGDKHEMLKYFVERVEERLENFRAKIWQATGESYDLLSELAGGRILEHPRLRATHFEK